MPPCPVRDTAIQYSSSPKGNILLSHRNPAGSHVREEYSRSGDLGVVRAGKLPCLEREAGREADHRNHHLRASCTCVCVVYIAWMWIVISSIYLV